MCDDDAYMEFSNSAKMTKEKILWSFVMVSIVFGKDLSVLLSFYGPSYTHKSIFMIDIEEFLEETRRKPNESVWQWIENQIN